VLPKPLCPLLPLLVPALLVLLPVPAWAAPEALELPPHATS